MPKMLSDIFDADIPGVSAPPYQSEPAADTDVQGALPPKRTAGRVARAGVERERTATTQHPGEQPARCAQRAGLERVAAKRSTVASSKRSASRVPERLPASEAAASHQPAFVPGAERPFVAPPPSQGPMARL